VTRRLAALLALVAALAVAGLTGCGVGAGESEGGGAELRVTRDFGTAELADEDQPDVKESDTVMRFLQSKRDVKLRYGGGFVQAIDGLEGTGESGQKDWFFFVNGEESDTGAADRKLHPGDVVQWDYRDWSSTMRVPAIVGAFPEPFKNGLDGEKIPVRVECFDPDKEGCKEVKDRLAEQDVIASGATPGVSSRGQVLRVMVGNWEELRDVRALRTLEQGPEASGVFAKFNRDGTSLDLLGPDGETARPGGPGTGLVAATKLYEQENVTWIITGTDDAGVAAAAKLLAPGALRNAFAVAATSSGPVKLPIVEGDGG
jgi:hypothetical protein